MKNTILSLTLLSLLALITNAQPVTYQFTGGEGNQIRFESKAPLETIVGITDQVAGNLTFDPMDLSKGVSGSISVPAATMKTGNTKRDGHMRENHLETEKYPDIQFTIKEAALTGRLMSGEKASFDVPGEFSLHGVTKALSVPAEVTVFQEGSVQKILVTAAFQVKLSEYQIARPQFLVMKLDEVQNITINIWGVVP